MLKVASSEFTIKLVKEDSLTEDSQASRKGVENRLIHSNCIRTRRWIKAYIHTPTISPLPPHHPTFSWSSVLPSSLGHRKKEQLCKTQINIHVRVSVFNVGRCWLFCIIGLQSGATRSVFRAGRQQQYWEQEACLVVQWQCRGHELDPWSRKISHATKPEHNCWSACAQSACSATREAATVRSLRVAHSEECLFSATRDSPQAATETQQS